MIFAIDPGTTQSAWVRYDEAAHSIHRMGIDANEDMLERVRVESSGCRVAVEMIASYGMPVGKEVFETCVWIGRFLECMGSGEFVYRKDVKLHLCGSTKSKDGNIRQAIIDLFQATGGGKNPKIGTKKQPGPLFGVHDDIWAALGVAITFAAMKKIHGGAV